MAACLQFVLYIHSYIVCSKINKSYAIMKVDIIITYFMCLCHVLVCSIDVPVESGGVIVLWSIVWDRYACIQSYMGFDCMQA